MERQLNTWAPQQRLLDLIQVLAVLLSHLKEGSRVCGLHQGLGVLGPECQAAQGKWDLAETKLQINVQQLLTIFKAVDFLDVRNQTLVV